MPELPEVETIVRELRTKIIDEVFVEFKPLWSGSFITNTNLALKKRQIEEINRKGKYIVFKLDKGFLLTHLRMTGQLIVKKSLPESRQHLRLLFKFQSGNYLLFYDLRKFGRIFFTENPEDVLRNTGIDALSEDFDLETFKKIGSVFQLKVSINRFHYFRPLAADAKLSDLSAQSLNNLFRESREVLLEAIDRMGSTISNYKTTGGGFGTNQNYFRVYQRNGLPCYVCKNTIKKTKIGGRGTHFCPKCQKMKN
jgi:formamidopyrimidine-DNA glycosylase